jgi:hypothetical protein
MVMVVVVSCLLVSRIVLILLMESVRVERKPLEEHINDDRDRA